MGEEDYKSNSHKMRENNEQIREKKIEPVVSSTPKVKKKTDLHKFAELFIAEDVSNVKNYILVDVLIPAFKKAIADIISGGINMLLYGDSVGKKSTGSKISYASYYTKQESASTSSSRFDSSGSNYDEIIFETRGEAESVLSAMDEIINTYGVVSIGDYYDLANISTSNYTINKYGWTNIRTAQVIRVRDGYLIKLPKAIPLN